jgi:LuxR family maltose regulon positive regulatory protein
MVQAQEPILAETPQFGVANFTSSVVPDDLEILLSQTNPPSRIVLICPAPNDSSGAIEIAMKTGDWDWAARVMIRSLAVSRILAGAGSDVVQLVVEQKEFGESEPLLLAAAALAHSWLDIAESALERASSELAEAAKPEATDMVSLEILNMAMSKLRDKAALGLAQARHAEDAMNNLTALERARAPELPLLIDYYVAGFELSSGNLGAARWTLERGAGRFRQWLDPDASPAEQRVRADCAGQLSWLDALCGESRRALRYAANLLTDRQADGAEVGVKFAHLATAWIHMERGEVEQAKQRLDHALSTASEITEPLLFAAERLAQARLATLTGEPESALRLLHTVDATTGSPWCVDQFRTARAEAWLAAGEPQQAIATLGPKADVASAEARLILARALRLAGDFCAAEETLKAVPLDPAAISLINQVQHWMLQAELAVGQGNGERAELLVDRALRAAKREQLRSTVSSAGPWLRRFVAREPGLSGRHSAFLTSLPEPAMPILQLGVADAVPRGSVVVPLTERETQVLERLAAFCSNEEIAADLFLSLNTVKTHLRSLFQKLSVTRRADAVRRGRAIGLC